MEARLLTAQSAKDKPYPYEEYLAHYVNQVPNFAKNPFRKWSKQEKPDKQNCCLVCLEIFKAFFRVTSSSFCLKLGCKQLPWADPLHYNQQGVGYKFSLYDMFAKSLISL